MVLPTFPFDWIVDQNFVFSSNFCSNCSDSVLLSFSFLYSLFFLSLMIHFDHVLFCGKLNLIASNNINSFYFSASSGWANSFLVFGWKYNAKWTPCLMETLSTWLNLKFCNLEKKSYFENARKWKDEAGRDKIYDALSSPCIWPKQSWISDIYIEHRWKAAKGRRVALVGPSEPCITGDGCWSGQSRVAA